MTERIERVDGEFHYAEWVDFDNSYTARTGVWQVRRRSDDYCVESLDRHNSNAEGAVAVADSNARHFIQQGREAALAEVDAAADKFVGLCSARRPISVQQFVQIAERRWGVISGEHHNSVESRHDRFTEALDAAALLNDGEAG